MFEKEAWLVIDGDYNIKNIAFYSSFFSWESGLWWDS